MVPLSASYLEVVELLGFVGSSDFGDFQPLFFQIFFLLLSLFLLWESRDMYVSLLDVPGVLQACSAPQTR